MIIEIHCPCGETLRVELRRGLTRAACPRCSRPHVLPIPEDRPGPSWVSISAASAGVLLVGLATLWAVLAAGPTGQGAGSDGTGQGRGTALAANDGDALKNRKDRRSGTVAPGGCGNTGDPATSGPAETQPTTEPSPPAKATTKPGPRTSPTAPPDVLSMEPFTADPATKPVTENTVDPNWRPAPGSNAIADRRNKVTKGGKGLAGKDGASKESEAAVELGLAWLAKVQSQDGHWEQTPNAPPSRGGNNSVGITGLATLAFLGGGYDHQGKNKYQKNVAKAIEWLLANQAENGRFDSRTFYEQGIAAMALCEACGMAGDKNLAGPATKAVTCVVENIGPTGGYGYEGGGDDTHVTSYQVMAMKSASLAEIQVPGELITKKKLRIYYDDALNADGTTNYSAGSRGGATPARTAVGLFCRVLLDVSRKDPKLAQIATLVAETGPLVQAAPANPRNDPRLRRLTGRSDVFQVYYGTYGMFQMGGQYWTDWNKRFRDPVVALQVKTGPDAGSWDARHGGRMGGGGQVCTTAIYIMALEVYYRYLPFNR